jgi:hypothetical protein
MRFLGDMLKRHARQVLTAGKADEVVADGGGVRPGHSLFTAHLLNGLEGAAATKEGVITANGVMAYVYEKVGRDEHSHQTPHFGYVAGDGDFVFDTALLEKLRANAADAADGRDATTEGIADVLLNTSSQVGQRDLVTESPVVSKLKELLSDTGLRIKLDDFVSMHVRRFLEAVDQRHFPVQESQWNKDEFAKRVQLYENAAETLQQLVILLAKWGDGEQLLLLERLFCRLAETDKGSAGLVVWLRLGWYPILLLIYSAGISALASRNYRALSVALRTPVQPDAGNSTNSQPILLPTTDHITEIFDAFKSLPDRGRNLAPISEHLFSVLQPELEDLLFLGRGYEDLFDRFEVLVALVYADLTDGDWGPIGRFGWKQRRSFGTSPFDKLVEEAKQAGQDWGPLKEGFFSGSLERFLQVTEKFKLLLKQMPRF